MALVGNIIWFILVGWWSFLLYGLCGVLCCITIIGIPIGKSLFQYAKLMALPFGKVIVKETDINGVENVSAVRRVCGVIANILWLPFGICFFLGNILVMIASAITIIGIPNAIVIAKSCKFMLWPVGAKVITKDEWETIRMQNAMNTANAPVNTSAIAQNSNAAETQQTSQSTAAPNQTMEHLKQSGAQTLDSLKENSGKAAAAIAATSAAGMSALQQKRQENTEKAVAKGADVSFDEVMDQLEAKVYKNTAMSWVMTFLEYIAAAVVVICMIAGMIYCGRFGGKIMPYGALYGIASALPVVFVVSILGVIKRNHLFVAVLLGVETLAVLLMGILGFGFRTLTFMSLVGVLVWYIPAFVTKTQLPSFQKKAGTTGNVSPASTLAGTTASTVTGTTATHFCAQCGTKITGNVKFCPKCGANQGN